MRPEETADDRESQPQHPDAEHATAQEPARQQGLTPEVRRLLGGPRSLRSRTSASAQSQEDAAVTPPAHAAHAPPEQRPAMPAETHAADPVAHPQPTDAAIPIRPRAATRPRSAAAVAPRPPGNPPAAAQDSPTPAPKQRGGGIRVDQQAKRMSGLYIAAFLAGGLLLLFAAFYVGKRYQYWKYLVATRNAPVVADSFQDKFPGLTSEELVDQALAAERSGDWRGAADRYLAAKYKDRSYQGLFFRIGRILFDHGDLAGADTAFAKAIEFGEDVARANHYRGLIATSGQKWPTAERFFAAAAAAEPLAPDRYIHWAESLRMGGNPKEAVRRYQQATQRATNDEVRTTSLFKTRIAELEAGNTADLEKAIAEQRANGELPVDWLLTAAAVEIYLGRTERGAELVTEARAGKDPRLFINCVRDLFFRRASEKNPAIAAATRVEFDPNQPAFR